MIIIIFILALYIIATFMYYYSQSKNWSYRNFLILAMVVVVIVSWVLINDVNELKELVMNL